MIIKESDNELAIVLCGHGSRNSNYLLGIKRLEEILSKKLKLNIYLCFIEINKPSIEECINKITKYYNKVLVFPLLLFEGRHLSKDVNERINSLMENVKKNVIIIDKLSLVNDIFPIIFNIINQRYSEKFDVLVTSCSFSKNNKVKRELELYTNKLSFSLKIQTKFFHFVGEEKNVFKELIRLKNHSLKILLHPVFFFDGYLYKKNIKSFSKLFTTINLNPLSHYDEISEAIFRKLIIRI